MYRILTASKDTYITNKIQNNTFRATDANVGQAGTLDLFKLYNESTISSEDASRAHPRNATEKPIELSRLLIKFPISEVRYMHNNSQLDVGDESFKAYVKLHDVYGGQTTPSNFDIILFPLAKKFDEGAGYDIVNFNDLDNTNWITASYTNGVIVPWSKTGAMQSGSLANEASIDVIVSGTLPGDKNAANESLAVTQHFQTGEEDLFIDVTKLVSASAKNLLSDNGYLIAFSGSYEKDNKSYFVKRFASRNTANTTLRPKLIIKYDDSIHDNHENFEFNHTGSLYLNNFNRGTLSNIISGSSGTELTGEQCMILKLQTGSFSKRYDVSQVLRGASKPATATITVGGDPGNDEKFTLIDMTGSISNPPFTFNTANNIVTSNNIGIQSALGNNNTIASRIASAINNSNVGIQASPTTNTVLLTQQQDGTLGNRTIDMSGITNVTSTNFTGGAYAGLTGIYSASFAISSFDTALYDHIVASGSVTFNEIWSNDNETVTYLSSSLKVNANQRSSLVFDQVKYLVTVINLADRYKKDEKIRIRVFAEQVDRPVVFSKLPLERKSEIFNNMHYRVKDFQSGDILIPFDTMNKSTRLSTDSSGMYFDFYMSSLPQGRTYKFDFLIKQNGFDTVIDDIAAKFIIE